MGDVRNELNDVGDICKDNALGGFLAWLEERSTVVGSHILLKKLERGIVEFSETLKKLVQGI